MNLKPGTTFNLVLFLAVLLCSAATAHSQDTADGAPVLAGSGKKLFLTYCVACHGLDATGNGPVAAALLSKPADLTTIVKRRGGNVSWGDIAKFIDGRTEMAAHGRRTMPVWGKQFNEDVANDDTREEMTRGDLAALISYLKLIQLK